MDTQDIVEILRKRSLMGSEAEPTFLKSQICSVLGGVQALRLDICIETWVCWLQWEVLFLDRALMCFFVSV